MLYKVEYWQSAKDKTSGEFIDYFLSDPALCRLFLGLGKLDPQTARYCDGVPGHSPENLRAYLGLFRRNVPSPRRQSNCPRRGAIGKAWAELAGAGTDKAAPFFERLLAKDDGWLASYYDALARINGPVKDYLAEPERLKRFYTALRGRVTSPGPARPVFRSNTDMLLLTTRLRMDPDGKPHLPGSLEVWKSLFVNHPSGKYDAKLTRAAPNWKDSDDVLEALFGLARKSVENEPLKIFMALSDVERNRTKPLEVTTVDRLAREYKTLNAQYPLFSEAPTLTDQTILQFLDTIHAINNIHDLAVKADAAGTMQALTGLWQIFVRQGSIPEAARTLHSPSF